jgi:hypothetical protein
LALSSRLSIGLYALAAKDIFAQLENYSGLAAWVSFFEMYPIEQISNCTSDL